MSLFKAKQWWSNEKLQENESVPGLQNGSCLKVDKFNSHSDSDCIVVGEGNLLKIYKPNQDENASHTLIESQMGETILQIETGKFVAGTADRQILVLHPQSYAVYQLHRKEGHTDVGDQNILNSLIKHSFTRRAYSVTCGPFGNIKTRDFICIQSVDGSLSFFDQETFMFIHVFSDIIIPGPVCYIASSDSFVICKSTWKLEIHGYQQLREFSELNVRQNKKNLPQWAYNAGEEISQVQIIQTSNNFSSIIALGERHIVCFQDNGLMKYMNKFDYMPVCFCAYLIGWYYEPGARLLVMIASDDSKLFIYENTTLLWSCDLLHQPVSLSRCFFKYLSGGLVSLSTNGIVTVSYLGTEPDLNANVTPMVNDNSDPDQIQNELEEVEAALHKIYDGNQDANNSTIDEVIKIKADIAKPVQNLFQEFAREEALHLLMCPVVIMLTCEDPRQIQSIQINYICSPPFACSEPSICLDTVNGTEIIETQIFISNEDDISDVSVRIVFVIIDGAGKINVISREVYLPLSLYCLPAEIATENEIILHITMNRPCIDFSDIFTDFSNEELNKHSNSQDSVSFIYRTTKKIVTLKASDNKYSIEAKDVAEITSVLEHFIQKLKDHYARNNDKEFRFDVKLNDEFIKQLIHRFLKSIESHAKERIKLKTLEDELNILQRQFTVIQKRLLVQYGSLPPGDCDPLEFLMKDTHQKLLQSVQEIILSRDIVTRAGNTLTAIGNLITNILKRTIADEFKVKLIHEMLAINSLYEDYQEWEEAVLQALPYILNNVFKKSEKDKEKLAPVSEQGVLSHINLKRFLKQIRMILENLFSEIIVEDNSGSDVENKFKVMRIEEFVEVI